MNERKIITEMYYLFVSPFEYLMSRICISFSAIPFFVIWLIWEQFYLFCALSLPLSLSFPSILDVHFLWFPTNYDKSPRFNSNGRLIFGLFHLKCIISHINVHISNVKHHSNSENGCSKKY